MLDVSSRRLGRSFRETNNVGTIRTIGLAVLAAVAALTAVSAPAAAQQQQRPNIIMIMGDDIGWFNDS
jgi:arylsulfatase